MEQQRTTFLLVLLLLVVVVVIVVVLIFGNVPSRSFRKKTTHTQTLKEKSSQRHLDHVCCVLID
uniref:Uncharacterized protein n=1 Tax=Anguilla anguilla TaxID=7936 RepID=A0A0E9WCV3_ANGAN